MCIRDRNSVHLLDIPGNEKDWFNLEHVKLWDNVRNVRRVVTGAIEVQRQEKVIGSSLEACPVIYIKDKGLFEIIKSVDMSEVCITSGINVEFSTTSIPDTCFILDDVPNVGVICKSAKGKKCQRCWTFNLPQDKVEGELCDRCQKAVS